MIASAELLYAGIILQTADKKAANHCEVDQLSGLNESSMLNLHLGYSAVPLW